jgi:hypothetical protein
MGTSILDVDVTRGLTRSAPPPTRSQEGSARGFAARWQAALERRPGRLVSEGVLDRSAHSASQEPKRPRPLQELARDVEVPMKLRLGER